jgi:hypothetical protein
MLLVNRAVEIQRTIDVRRILHVQPERADPPAAGEPREYSIVLSILGNEGQEITRQSG